MATIHAVKIIPGSNEEHILNDTLQKIGVKIDRVICKKGSIFETRYDEYLISDGLYKQIAEVIDNLRGRG